MARHLIPYNMTLEVILNVEILHLEPRVVHHLKLCDGGVETAHHFY